MSTQHRTWRVTSSDDPTARCVLVTVKEGDKTIASDPLEARELIKQVADRAHLTVDIRP